MNKFKKFRRFLKALFVIFLVASWLLTGWPGISIGPDFHFPPEIKETKAAVAFNVASESHTGTTGSASQASFTWNHAAAASGIKGVLVFTFVNANADNATSVTYGGVSLTAVSGGRALATSTEPGDCKSWFLGSSVPQGTQAVVVNRTNNTNVMYAVAITVTGSTDTEISGTPVLLQGASTQALVEQNVDSGSASALRFACVNSGLSSVPAAGANSTSLGLGASIDFGTRVIGTVQETTAGSGSRPVGFSAAADDVAAVHLAIAEKSTILGNGTDGGNSSIGPGGSATEVDRFSFNTTSGTDSVTGLTVTLGPAGAYNNIATVDVQTTAGVSKCSTTPSGDAVSLSTCGISVTTTPTEYKIMITPKTHANIPAPPGASYDTTATVTGWTQTSTNVQVGTDSGSATVTIDNLSPNAATSVGGSAGNAAVTLNWTSSSSTDFDTTNGSVILRWASGTAGSEVPAEGNSSYVAGNTITTATVACVISSATSTALSKIDGTGGSAGCTTSALTNGQAYTYKAFQRDTNGNYDAGTLIGAFTPSAAAATFTQNKYLWYVDNDLADPTAIWGTPDLIENQAIVVVPPGNDPPDSSQELRLRVNYVVNTTSIAISEKYFKLEYKAGTDGSCTTGSWTDVGTGAWVYATSTVTDGADIVKVLSDTTTGKGEEYVKAKPSHVNHVAANAAEIIEYDFHIVGTSSTANTQYSFRVVETNAGGTSETVFDAYTNCPTLTTEPGTANLLRHGNIFTEGLEKGFFWAD